MAIEEMLLHMAASVGIGVPDFIDCIVLPFKSSFAEVEGHELGRDVGDEGVTHGEEQVAAFVAGEKQVITQGWLPLIGRILDCVVRCTTFHPNEFPVEIEVVGQFLACLEGGVLSGALGMDADACRADDEEKKDDFSHAMVREVLNR